MPRNICLRHWRTLLACLALGGSLASGQVSVLTRNYNNQRTGANLAETALNVSNVNPAQFGKLFMLPVDDQVYAGILYVAALQIAGGTHNVIYVATANNSVYAFDADALGSPLWSRNFNGSGQPSVSTGVGGNCNPYTDFRGNIGIVGTPVIDASAQTMYFVTRVVLNGTTVQSLHAVNITNGADQPNSPHLIQASVPGSGDGGTSVVFNAVTQNQRPALALSQGIVYISWSSFCDTPPYHGWVLAYNGASLTQLAAFNATPNGTESGIWMAGAGPVFDTAGNLYYALGNGTSDGATNYGESMVKLAPNSLSVGDYFTPSNFTSLNAADLDFGSAGPSMLPGTSLLVSGGKEGKLYLLNTADLGHEVSGDVQIPQVFQAVDLTIRPSATHHIHNANTIWNSPEGLNVYVWGENDFLHAFQFNASMQKLNTPAYATGSVLPPQGMPGGMMTISASASQAGTGIVWASVPRNGDANQFTTPGNLYAFNAENLNLLYSSTSAGDDLLNFSKGSTPIVANGKLYVGSLSRFVEVYGLKTSGVYSQDLALNQSATGSAPCNPPQTPSQAVNGSFSGGPDDKWCSSAASPYLQVDLGSLQNISRFVVEHAGAGGEALSLNTAAFNIQVSSDGVNFTTVVNVTGNVDSITTHDIALTTARYVQLNILQPTSSGNPPASIYEFQVFGPQTSASPDFSLLEKSSSGAVAAGSSVTYTPLVGPLYGFTGTLTFSASGLPAGATAKFSPASVSGSGSSTLTVSTASNTPVGTYTVNVTGVSGALQHSNNVTLVVTAPGASVNLGSVYNRIGILTDGSTTTASGLDQFGYAYSANLLGTSVFFGGSSFTLGPPNAPDVVANATIPLPAGSYSTLNMLATAVNGSQASQSFVVKYSDGTSSTFTQSLSDWHIPQNFVGETAAVTMPYRDAVNGVQSFGLYNLYAYSFPLNSAKTVSSIVLPNNGNVVVLAVTLAATAGTADFAWSAAPASQTVTAGGTGSYTATVGALNGFTGTVTLSASGLPAGTTAGFNPATVGGAGTSVVGLLTTSATPAGTYTVTLTGTSGALQHSTTVTLVVNAAASTGTPVNLAALYNRSAIVTDGSTFTSGGLDMSGHAYSANLLGSALSLGGSSFTLGPANVPDAVSSTTVPLPAGQYSKLSLLGTAINGNQGSQTFVVNYNDGTNSTFVQSLSDWFTPQSFTGESKAATMAYRDVSNGTEDNRTFYLYGYSFALNSAKTAASITLPNNGNVIALAITLTGTTASADFSLSASPGSQTVTAGATGSYTATVGALNGFTGTVTLSASGLPAGTTASFNPATMIGAGTSALSLITTGSTAPGTYTITLTGTSGTLQHSTTVTLIVNAPADFSLSATPGSVTVTAGGTGGYTATVGVLNGFTGTVTLSASGLPAGTTARFNPSTVIGAGTSALSLVTTASTTPGTYTVTLTGTSGALLHNTTMTLVVNAATSTGGPVNLATIYNRSAMVTDGSTFTSGGLDFSGHAYSANLLGSSMSVNGSSFTLGPANALDAVTSTTIPVTAGQYSKLAMLATAINGNQGSQSFVVNYNDGTNSTFVQSLSDWFTPQNYSGEIDALAMPYRDVSNGTEDNRTFNLYAYSFALNNAKTAISITLPNNVSVVVLALTLSGTTATADFSLSAAPGSQTVTAGGTGNYTATVGALNGFTGTVTLSASGLPAGATASFNLATVSGSGTSAVSLMTSASTATGTYSVTLTGTSGTLQHSSAVTLVVNAATSVGGPVSLTAVYNRTGIVTDGTTFTGGLDGFGYAYSSNLLGSTVTSNASTYSLGPANAPDVVTSTTVPLTAGQYSTLSMLAAGMNGSQGSQSFVVNYSDGTHSTFTQSLSDWFTPQNYAGETAAVTMAYRDGASGAKDNRTFYLYRYAFAINNAKVASSITLPNNANVVVLAITLAP